MPSEIHFSAPQIATFKRVHEKFWPVVVSEASLTRRRWDVSDDEVVVNLIRQVAVIGNAKAGSRVTGKHVVWTGGLERQSRKQRMTAIHRALQDAGARWAGRTLDSCR